MDNGIFSGNYHDYPDDEVAIQREFEIADALEGQFRDEDFPANARSLYFDPLNPPKGAIPNETVKWFSLSQGDVVDCNFPEFFKGDHFSCLIDQGALGDGYFVNALRLMCCQPKYITRLLVSDKFALQGLYTLKFCKAGKWRYVHIDDRIPCRQSGRTNFCRNVNPNETFAMLLEKGYAKLHGCYEAIACGMIEKVFEDLTASAAVQALRLERFPAKNVCNEVWDLIERGIAHQQLIGCGRFVSDPYGENPARRRGITLGCVYQVMDAVISSAEPTEDLDAITVGFVCVRNLQHNAGRYTGRWSHGHKIWSQYKEIAFDIRHRTREIQYKRGLGPNPNDSSDAAFDDKGNKVSLFPEDVENESDPDDENDDLDVAAHEKKQTVKLVQPMAEDLHWIQIEDFVEVFNRIYLTNDHTLSQNKDGATKRFVSKWIPGDFIGGSGGPPIIITTQTEVTDSNASGHGGGAGGAGGDGKASKRGTMMGSRPSSAHSPASATKNTTTTTAASGKVNVIARYAMISETFTDNPMYPFSVTEPTSIGFSLFQKDRRFAMGRLGDNARDVLTKQYASRRERLQACMEYPVGISFLVVKLSGLKHRLTEFKLRKIVSGSENMCFSNVATNMVYLRPGRYAVIPYTHTMLSRSMDYVLCANYTTGHVDFEIEDVLEQRLVDDAPSDEDDDEELQPDDNDLLHLHDDSDDVSIMSYEKVKVVNGDGEFDEEDEEEEEEEDEESLGRQKALTEKVNPPRLLLYKPWEYSEDLEELGVQQVFTEVGEVMKYVKTLRGEVRKLHATIRALNHVQAPPPMTTSAPTAGGAAGSGLVSPNKAPRGAFFAADASGNLNSSSNAVTTSNGAAAAVGPNVKSGVKGNGAEDLKTNTTSASAAVTSGTAESGGVMTHPNATSSATNNTNTQSSARAAATETKSSR